MSKVEELNKLALKLTGSNPYKKTIKESLESIATYLAGENVEVENIEDAIQKCTEYYSGGGGGGNAKIEGPINESSSFNIQSYITEIDFEGITTNRMHSIFNGCSRLVKVTNLDTSSVTFFSYAFKGCTNLKEIPELDTSSGIDFREMFYGCTSIENLPILNMGSVTNLSWADNIFKNCSSLNSNSLRNVLKALLTLGNTSFGTKSLAYVGLNQTQATACTEFEEWTTLTSRGWTTGY